MNLNKLVLYILLISPFSSLAQEHQLLVGEWDDFLPYNRGLSVTQSDDAIYYGTEYSILKLDKDDLNPSFIGKTEGLGDVGIQTINFDRMNEQLIIIYNNSTIDVYTELEIVTISDIKDNKNIVGSKKILDVHIFDENSAFLATGFGIVELNLKTLDFGSTIFTEIPVNDICSDNNVLYAATENGIYSIIVTENTNIADFSKWHRIGDELGLSENYSAEWIEVSGDNIYTVINEELLVSNNKADFAVTADSTINAQDISFLSKVQGGIIVGLETMAARSKAFILKDDGSQKEIGNGCINFVKNAIQDEEGRVWFAEQYSGFRYTKPNAGGCEEPIRFNTPSDIKVTDIDIIKDELYIATGGADIENGYKLLDDPFNFSGILNFNGEIWKSFTGNSLPIISEKNIFNLLQVEVNPNNEKIMFGSFLNGLLEYDPATNEVNYFDNTNSPLHGFSIAPDQERISGIAFDKTGNLWINNFGSPTPLAVRDTKGEWSSFNVNTGEGLVECIVDQSGYVWSVVIGSGDGVHVYDPGQDVLSSSDDQQRVITSSNSEIDGKVNSVIEDLDGQIWVGTTKGPVIFDSGSGIFDSSSRGNRRKVLQDSIVAFLLETEDIRTMEVDGANRKWFGTRNGIFVQSPDGELQIEHFTSENSPLFNNTIKELKFDENKGVMYIGTDYGVQLFRTETLGAQNVHNSTVYAFPNPVTPNYNGDIYIKGLARDANVKITDLNGKLVYETNALGGQAVWNGMDYNGKKATTGVYLVFSTGVQSFDTPDTYVTKIMIVN